MPLSDEDVREILRIIDQSELTELRIDTDGFSLHVLKRGGDAEASGRKAPVVLLSPACASFDQYPNFEVRGRFFVAAVQALPEVPGVTK